jgi:methionyl aminopeptidase
MRAAGLVVWQAHQAAARLVKPGVTTAELNRAIADTFRDRRATPLFLGYGPPEHPFPAETCISINEEIVHGIPGSRKLKSGDIVSLDTGCRLDTWCGDAAVTHAVGKISSADERLLNVTRKTLELAIKLLASERNWSSAAAKIQLYVENSGFAVVQDMTGHGIGHLMHEPPQVPNFWHDRILPKEDFEIRPGLVIAVEPMVNAGSREVRVLDDQWTTVTSDGAKSAHFEHTVAISNEGPVCLTGPPDENELSEMPDWLHDRSQWYIW